jgi:hypothetical protein
MSCSIEILNWSHSKAVSLVHGAHGRGSRGLHSGAEDAFLCRRNRQLFGGLEHNWGVCERGNVGFKFVLG